MIAGGSYKQGGSLQQEEEEEEGGGNCQSQAYWMAECVFGMLGEGGQKLQEQISVSPPYISRNLFKAQAYFVIEMLENAPMLNA